MLASILTVVEVKDNEIVLHFENGLLKQVLTAGRYAFWKSVIRYDFISADISKIGITENIDRAVLMNKLVAPYVRTKPWKAMRKQYCLWMVSMRKFWKVVCTTGGRTTS